MNIKNTYSGRETAVISLQKEEAAKLLPDGKLRIGWVIYRIKECAALVRCFQCLELGHIKQCVGPFDQ